MTSQETDEKVKLMASCLCKNHVFTTSIPSSSLPLEAWTCHCTSCRHVSGALYTHDTLWPGSIDEVKGAVLSLYQMSKNVALLFCGRCSSPMFWWERYEDQPEVLDVLIGALECDVKTDLIETVRHIFVGDTVDGGAAPWLRKMREGQKDIPMWWGRHEKSRLMESEWNLPQAKLNDRGSDDIPIVCHCGGVNLLLRRGDADFAETKAEDLPFFVDPGDYKLLASFDGCNSCRKSFGINVMNWTFTLLKHIAFADGSSFPTTTLELRDAVSRKDADERLGTLAFYSSSADVQRYFCSRCSASVFYAVDDRPNMVDLSVGLLDSPDGARVESRLAWALGPPVTWRKDAVGSWREGFVKQLEENTEEWRVNTGKENIWSRANKARRA